MKFRRTRDEYWLEVSDSATSVMENVIPTTDIIELAIVESIPRDPSAPAPNSLGNRMRDSALNIVLAWINPIASTAEKTTMVDGTNQKLEVYTLHSRLIMFDSPQASLESPSAVPLFPAAGREYQRLPQSRRRARPLLGRQEKRPA